MENCSFKPGKNRVVELEQVLIYLQSKFLNCVNLSPATEAAWSGLEKDQWERGVSGQVFFSHRGLTFGSICLGFNDVQPISSMNKRGHIVELV